MNNKLGVYSGNVLLIPVIILLNSTAVGLIIPVWPIYIKALGASMTELGFIFSMASAMSAILQIPSGLFSDKYGRKRIHALGVFLGIFPPLFCILSRSWVDLIPWVILLGVSRSLYEVRHAMVADASTIQTRAIAYSWMNVAMLSGFTIAPILGGFLADLFGIWVPFAMSFLLFCSCFPLALLIRETRRGGPTIRIDDPQGKTLPITFSTVVIISSLVNIIQGMGIGVTGPLTPIFVTESFSVTLTFVGLLEALCFGLASLIVQIPGGKLADKYGRKKLLIASFLFSAPFFALFVHSTNVFELFLFMFLANAILNLSWPAFQALLIDYTPPSKWGLMNGISTTTFWIGQMTGSMLSGTLWDSFGKTMPYYVSASAILLSTIPLLFLREKST